MDKMKKQVTTRLAALSIVILLLVALSAFVQLGPGFPSNADVNSHVLSFQHGLLAGSILALSVFVFRLISVLKSEEKLKKMYYELTDERMAMVRMKSGAPSLMLCAVCLFLASFVAMYINTTVSITLIASAVFALFLGVFRKAYYHHKLSASTDE